ncbi:hypothetical protein O181_049946 [Austropuccinia psidii MF-1]|uniref:Uncharacterized protein n=1 Tax=Austropuccinia psidii MF-1 TaxID=1389203 RepID=A0A9Q3E0W9_9BASI|nr:hypothetical protein [Austropuccinia psidii MF-1]
MPQPPTEGEFQNLELLWKYMHNSSREKRYSVSTLRSNMTHNQIETGCDRPGTPNSYKNSFKTVTSRKLECPFRLYEREYTKSTNWNIKVKKTQYSHDATESMMEHPAFREFNEQESPQIFHIS